MGKRNPVNRAAKRIYIAILFLAVSFFISYPVLAKEAETFESMVETGKVEYIGMESCAACHEDIARDFSRSTHAKFIVSDPKTEGQGCESCHGPGSKHVDAGGGRGVFIINPGKDPTACYKCHLEKKMEFSLQYHHPVPEGKISCSDCHDPHKGEVRPGSAASLEGKNGLCFKCHPDKKGPFVWTHEAMYEGCTICHNPHGSINDKMLIMRDSTLCLQCHAQTNYPTIAGNSHATRLPRGACFSGGCHTAVHGSNFSDHFFR